MVNLLYMELLKLKRSHMFLISIFGASAAPFISFIASLTKKAKLPYSPLQIDEFFSETHLYCVLLIGVPLYGVIAAYLFHREYAEGTLKNLLTIPVSRMGLILSKWALLALWIMALTLISCGWTYIFGLVGPFEGWSTNLLVESFNQFVTSGILLWLLTPPMILVTYLFKSYVTTIVFTIIITMVNLMIFGTEYSALFPWSAVQVIATSSFFPEYPPTYSYLTIMATSFIGFFTTLVYFNKADIH
ncbi:ABC transporter permease [Paludifilum halophilum]|uniref:Bacitracin ABC transporter permease n=1 Tax=Paludifilum halophilum TaxID=1642702 RepID=A0A235B5A0_9BACL|nr:ABC transporter permease [Paludifilum halophilum]OYD07139.1 bacitracin ABC transporter permease [Paludifilum halophilum]